MGNTHNQPLTARVVVIGILQLNDHTELRLQKEPWGWRPDLVVNMATEELSAPPPCFSLNAEGEALLNEALYKWSQDEG